MYTFADVPKHRLYYCAHTNRYTDTDTCCAHQLDGSPGSIKRSFILSGKLQTHLNVGSFFMFVLYEVLLTLEKQFDLNGKRTC